VLTPADVDIMDYNGFSRRCVTAYDIRKLDAETLTVCTNFCKTPSEALAPGRTFECAKFAHYLARDAKKVLYDNGRIASGSFDRSNATVANVSALAIFDVYSGCMTQYCQHLDPDIGGCPFEISSARSSLYEDTFSNNPSNQFCSKVVGKINPDIGGIGVCTCMPKVDEYHFPC
jgi:hypothetical protein